MNEKQLILLLRCAELFMKYGIRSITIDDIANQIGVSKKTLYNNFTDKNQLVEHIIILKIEEDKKVFKLASKEAINAIDELYRHTKYVIETFSSINPSVFHDLRKNHSAAWQLTINHKWDFVYNQFLENINRGIKEGIYRNDIHKEIYAKMFVSNIETIIEGEVFPWPQFTYETVFLESFRLHVRGITNMEGLVYFQNHILKK